MKIRSSTAKLGLRPLTEKKFATSTRWHKNLRRRLLTTAEIGGISSYRSLLEMHVDGGILHMTLSMLEAGIYLVKNFQVSSDYAYNY